MYNGKFGTLVALFGSWSVLNRYTAALHSPLKFQFGSILSLNPGLPPISRREHGVPRHAVSDSDSQSRDSMSHIASIRCQNFAGVTGEQDDGNLEMCFESNKDSFSNLVVVSGETGHGKSLLISKVVDLVTGGKASASLLHNPTKGSSATVEIVLNLCSDDHVEMVRQSLEALNVDSDTILGDSILLPVAVTLKRTLRYASTGKNQRRLQSVCYINDHPVPLKLLKGVGAPLLPVVNAPAAASAIGQASSRLAMIDAGVPFGILVHVHQLTRRYNQRRKERESLEQELASRTLPVSMTENDDDDKDLELLQHWIDELSGFERRILDVVTSLTHGAVDNDSELGRLLEEVVGLDWMDSDSTERGFSSSLYRCLLELFEELKAMDQRIEASFLARDSLGSLSSKDSARAALERTRRLLLDVGEEDSSDTSKLSAATEKAHDLLNQVEAALTECTTFLDDDDNGLLAVLQNERDSCSISSENLWDTLLEWNTLARKHGISPYLLPSCHAALRQELDGNVEARTLLPKARLAEQNALEELQTTCQVLSQARRDVAARLSLTVSDRLPSLGMDSRLLIEVNQQEDPSLSSRLGIDDVDFFLYHNNVEDTEFELRGSLSTKRGGKVESVASAGEIARIILAIECQVPGSIRALCGVAPPSSDSSDSVDHRRPVAVIYDEIDAHVGGRALVSVGQLLSEQSESYQVVAITHSASLAATADLHICVQKQAPTREGVATISAQRVDGTARLKELARMASGDMAMAEAEAFAEALIDAATMRQRQTRSKSSGR